MYNSLKAKKLKILNGRSDFIRNKITFTIAITHHICVCLDSVEYGDLIS